LGYIPNRFFRADFDLSYIGSTPSAALIRDQTITVGQNPVLEPKLGVAYVFADYKELGATAFLGTYYETAREEGNASRIHLTSGVEVKPWVVTVGWGVDTSALYLNYLFSLGVDVFKIMEKLDLIPTGWHPARQGFLPNPFHESELGLPRPLQKNWKPRGPDMNPIDIALELPKKIGEKVEDIANTVAGGEEPIPHVSPTPTPLARPRKDPLKLPPGFQKKIKKQKKSPATPKRKPRASTTGPRDLDEVAGHH
jgi:hypothetical protein